MTTRQPEALRREYRASMPPEVLHMWAADALARIASLEAQLEAIGAGGISPLIAGAGFDAADMATAAAQGFRDGVASVSAGGEPTEQQILEAAEKAGLWPNTVRSWIPAFHRYHKELAKAQAKAQAQADSVQEDAARYRWLRNKSQVVHNKAWFGGMSVRNHYGDFLCRDDALAALDTAVDAARKQGEKQ